MNEYLGLFFDSQSKRITNIEQNENAMFRTTVKNNNPSHSEFDFFNLNRSSLPTAAIIYQCPDRAEARQILSEIKELEEGWDGYGAYKISEEACDIANTILHTIPYNRETPDIVPTANGTISLSWDSQNNSFHLEIGKTMYSYVSLPRHGKKIYIHGKTEDLPKIQGFLIPDETKSSAPTILEIAA